MNPPNFFCRIHNKTWLNTRSHAKEIQTYFPGPPPGARQRPVCLPTPLHSKTNLGRILVSAPASRRTSSSKRIEPCWVCCDLPDPFGFPTRVACTLGVNTLPGYRRPASLHRDAASVTFLADGTWRRHQSMSPFNCHAMDFQHSALTARFVARPLSVGRISDMLSPRRPL